MVQNELYSSPGCSQAQKLTFEIGFIPCFFYYKSLVNTMRILCTSFELNTTSGWLVMLFANLEMVHDENSAGLT